MSAYSSDDERTIALVGFLNTYTYERPISRPVKKSPASRAPVLSYRIQRQPKALDEAQMEGLRHEPTLFACWDQPHEVELPMIHWWTAGGARAWGHTLHQPCRKLGTCGCRPRGPTGDRNSRSRAKRALRPTSPGTRGSRSLFGGQSEVTTQSRGALKS